MNMPNDRTLRHELFRPKIEKNNFRRNTVLTRIIIIFTFICSCHLYAQAKNTVLGYTGIIVTPTAQISRDGELSASIGRIPKLYANGYAPYDRTAFVASMGFMPFLEASFGFVRPDNFQGGVGDRTITVRIQVLSDKANLPAIAFGFHDFFAIENLDLEPESAQHFAAMYAVATKKIPLYIEGSSLVLNAGYGFDWLPARDSHLQGFFWGLQYSPIKDVDLLLEHDVNNFNAGIRFIFFSHFNYMLSFWQLQHLMHQVGFSLQLK